MLLFETIDELHKHLKSLHPATVGFVPTMGALHEGHIALINQAKENNQIVVCSIFVNPTQFNNKEDLDKYPRTLSADCELLSQAYCDVVFAPSAAEMYAQTPTLKLDFGYLEHIMEGKFRPGHFNGVGIVVAKLFNIIKPTNAYFGQKDIQQVAVVSKLINELSFDLNLVPCTTIRELDGLAMSSRNRRLSDSARQLAPNIYASLQLAKTSLLNGKNIADAKKEIESFFASKPDFKLEYFEITDYESLNDLQTFDSSKKTALVIACFLDNVRLIDNLVF